MGGTEDQDRFLAYPDPTSALAWAASGERDIFVDQEELCGIFLFLFFHIQGLKIRRGVSSIVPRS